MSLLALVLTALFAVGALYIGIKVRDDWQAGRRGLTALGGAALIGVLIMLLIVGDEMLAPAGDGFLRVTGLWD